MIVLHIETGKETDAALKLAEYAPLLPMEMRYMRLGGSDWVPMLRPLMPGYLFLDTELSDADYYIVKDTSGVLRVMNFRDPLPEDEAALVRRLCKAALEPHLIDKNGNVISGFFRTEQLIKVHKRQRQAEFVLTLMQKQMTVKTAATFLQ